MKGLITDLDNTLWGGEAGEQPSYSLDTTGMYSQYQSFLKRLHLEGILLGIASRNNHNRIVQVFEHNKHHFLPLDYFTLRPSWGPKYKTITEILNTWNILASDVVFVDDNPFEIAQVESVHNINTILFDPNDFWGVIEKLRKYFPKKEKILYEDTIRASSIERGVEFEREKKEFDNEDKFYDNLDQHITVSYDVRFCERSFELANKTNQFNMDGKRYTWKEWNTLEGISFSLSYSDKFGDLGKILVCRIDSSGTIRTFCMSCRAIGRRIEYFALHLAFVMFDYIKFPYIATFSNAPFYKFMRTVLIGEERFFNKGELYLPKILDNWCTDAA